MDYPATSEALNVAARNNDVATVKRLLTKMNPNCIDYRGWTCLHHAADNDSYECILLILNHPDCRPLAESHAGNTALCLAYPAYPKSVRTFQALLERVPDIANYGSIDKVTPLHFTSGYGRIDCMELLIKYGAMVNVQDFRGDTPLHYAAEINIPEAVNLLLHAGADPEIKNEDGHTAFHRASYSGCIKSVQYLVPFITDITDTDYTGYTALDLAIMKSNKKIVKYLMDLGAVPNLQNQNVISSYIRMEDPNLFKIVNNRVTDQSKLYKEIVIWACEPNTFNYEIVSFLLTHLGQEFFEYDCEPFLRAITVGKYKLCYLVHAPLNTYLKNWEDLYRCCPDKFRDLFYLLLMKGLSTNALIPEECPPLVFIQFNSHETCFEEVFKILMEHGCNVDYCSSHNNTTEDMCIPDAFLMSLQCNPSTTPIMLPFSIQCDPDLLLKFAHKNGFIDRIQPKVQETLLSMTGLENTKIPAESIPNTIFPLKHLSRLKIRHVLRKRKGIEKSSRQFFKTLDKIKLPRMLKNYLRYH